MTLWAAYAWTIANCALVLLIRRGAGMYRVESSILILAAVAVISSLRGSDGSHVTVDWSRKQQLTIVSLSIAIWAALMLPMVRFPFISDDYVFLYRYRGTHDIVTESQFFRPLFAAVFVILQRVGGQSPVTFHVVAFILHLATAVVVYQLATWLLRRRASATIAAIIFLLNPTQLESTLWVSGLQEILWVLFALSAAIVYCRGQLTIRRALAAAGVAGLALLSKETAICFVLVFAIVDLTRRVNVHRATAAVSYALFFGEIAAYLAIRAQFASMSDERLILDLSLYMIKQFVVTPYRTLALPWSGEVLHVSPIVSFAIVAAMVTALAISARPPGLRLLTGPLFILASTIPVAGYFFVGADLSSARYVYCAAAGWGLFLSVLISRTCRRPVAQVLATAIVVAGYAVALSANLGPWNTVGQIVDVMAGAVRRGEDPMAALAVFERQAGVRPVVAASGLPDNYKGVYVFRNGYTEFVALVTRRPSG